MCVIFRTSKALPLNIKRVTLNKVQALLGLVLVLSISFFKEKSTFIFFIPYNKTNEVLALEPLEKLSLLRLVSDFEDG